MSAPQRWRWPLAVLVAAAIVVVVLAAVAAGLRGAEDDVCDAEDLANREAECGYYNEHSVWVLYPWVLPGVGGHPPAGHRPRPPAGVRVNPPKPAPPARPPRVNHNPPRVQNPAPPRVYNPPPRPPAIRPR